MADTTTDPTSAIPTWALWVGLGVAAWALYENVAPMVSTPARKLAKAPTVRIGKSEKVGGGSYMGQSYTIFEDLYDGKSEGFSGFARYPDDYKETTRNYPTKTEATAAIKKKIAKEKAKSA